jgi:hypothetical protein
MKENDEKNKNEKYYKSVYSKKAETFYMPIENKIYKNQIIQYSYPLCVLRNIKKESEEVRKIKNRIINYKKEIQKEKDIKEKLLYYKLIYKNKNLKRNSSIKLLKINGIKKLTIQNNNLNINNKKLIKSSSAPVFDKIQQDNYSQQKDYLSQIEKRGNYYNKKIIASLQRQALNKISSSVLKRNDEDYFSSNINNCNIIEEAEKKKLPEVRQFLNNRIIIVNSKNNFRDDFFNIDKKQLQLHKLKKKEIKKTKFDKNQIEKDYNKPLERELRMTKNKIRDLKVMESINKIRDPDIIKKYKTLLNT